ncbi:helix-turn-helix domain-containing protein [Leucobacter soli]|uniref:helix-turn-helix domain-containing protein n=1 Tax=Leucobacter soli TaxID=2812850 RepID=UPI003611A4BA
MAWFWIPEWALPPGEESRQEILPFPACNLVVEPGRATIVGPPTTRSERVLTGSGWAVGALLRPASVPALGIDAVALRDAVRPLDDLELLRAVTAAMSDAARDGDARRDSAAAALAAWIRDRVPAPPHGSTAALANALADAIADPAITRVAELEPRLHTSTRTLQRIAERCFGVPLHAMIRRRRLQEAAARLREDPEATISRLASELGYADHAHFTTDFTALLGMPPSDYRKRLQDRVGAVAGGTTADRSSPTVA